MRVLLNMTPVAYSSWAEGVPLLRVARLAAESIDFSSGFAAQTSARRERWWDGWWSGWRFLPARVRLAAFSRPLVDRQKALLMSVTIYEIAERAGVSSSTVARIQSRKWLPT